MAKKKKRINEYDQNPAEKIQRSYKKKKRVRRFRVFFLILVIIGLGYYFYSPYSRLNTIEITGNQYISQDSIRAVMGYQEDSIRLFVSRMKIKNSLEAMSGVQSVSVNKVPFKGLKITIKENSAIAYQENEGSITVIFDDGSLAEVSDQNLYRDVQSLPKLSQFTDGAILQQFATAFAQVESSVRLQMSEILFEPLETDPLRVRMISNDSKESYVRIDEMVYQLSYYNGIVSQNPGNCYFDFLGSNVYQRACD